jgi:hypothetical protein
VDAEIGKTVKITISDCLRPFCTQASKQVKFICNQQNNYPQDSTKKKVKPHQNDSQLEKMIKNGINKFIIHPAQTGNQGITFGNSKKTSSCKMFSITQNSTSKPSCFLATLT